MLHHICTIHDQKAAAYLPPFILPAKGQATRAFADCINSETHQFHLHPYDYTLFVLGTFDDETAKLHPFPAAESLGNGVEFLKLDHTQGLNAHNAGDEYALSNDPPIQPGAEGNNS